MFCCTDLEATKLIAWKLVGPNVLKVLWNCISCVTSLCLISTEPTYHVQRDLSDMSCNTHTDNWSEGMRGQGYVNPATSWLKSCTPLALLFSRSSCRFTIVAVKMFGSEHCLLTYFNSWPKGRASLCIGSAFGPEGKLKDLQIRGLKYM